MEFHAEEDVVIYGIDVYYLQQEPELSFNGPTWLEAVVGEDVEVPEVVNPYNLPLTYTSSDPNVATAAPFYNMQGQQLAKPVQKGIYIRGGKKTVIK